LNKPRLATGADIDRSITDGLIGWKGLMANTAFDTHAACRNTAAKRDGKWLPIRHALSPDQRLRRKRPGDDHVP
jgi:hypothetical protein